MSGETGVRAVGNRGERAVRRLLFILRFRLLRRRMMRRARERGIATDEDVFELIS